jgi:hypothetical protein
MFIKYVSIFQTVSATDAHLAEGQFLRKERTVNREISKTSSENANANSFKQGRTKLKSL